MAEPLLPGAVVKVVLPPEIEGGAPRLSAPTTIAKIMYLTEEGEVSETPTARFQYLMDGDEPFADTAF